VKKKIVINTLGCKVNQYESASFLCSFEESGCRMAKKDEDADIVIINTCAVTAKAGSQSRRTVRRLMRRHPQAKIVITGCYAQMAANELAEMIETPICIVGNGNKHLLVEAALKESPCDLTMLMGKILKKKKICHLPMRGFGNRTRAYLRVQDGCNNFCTYCIVPYTRGPSLSLSLPEVMKQADRFQQARHKEIVLTGIHVGMYGRDLEEESDIADLMLTLCQSHPDIRFRLSSIEPTEISDKLLRTMSSCQNFMPHFHIPLQSGDDTILKRMHRGYDRETFRTVVNKCRATFPDAAIGIDILTGFPGEEAEEFANTKTLLTELDATYFHVFPFSSRPGTQAATYKNQVSQAVREERVAELRAFGEEKRATFYKRYLGTKRPVLVEHKRNRDGLLAGFTDNYIPVAFHGENNLMGKIIPIHLQQINGTTVMGRYK
jgi:threonylcarbamoyladenosine tRNA methylthiotransferase MtaB